MSNGLGPYPVALLALDEILRREHLESGSTRSIFIVAAPRTGSTLLYQLLAHCCSTVWFNNSANDDFWRTPAIPTVLMSSLEAPAASFQSRYGKTAGPLQPSEASRIFGQWFGGGHPSEVVSKDLLCGQRDHFISTVRSIVGRTDRPLLTKNAWNVFRVPTIADALPESTFVTIARDVFDAAASDFESRLRQGSPEVWNSASPRNYEELRLLPGWAQSIEQQIAFRRRLDEDFAALSPQRTHVIDYEALCADPVSELRALLGALGDWSGLELDAAMVPELERSPGAMIPDDIAANMRTYLESRPTD